MALSPHPMASILRVPPLYQLHGSNTKAPMFPLPCPHKPNALPYLSKPHDHCHDPLRARVSLTALQSPVSVRLKEAAKAELAKRYAAGTPACEALIKLQRWTRGWFTRYRSTPNFLEELVGKNVRTVLVFMHGSGGLVYNNVRMGRVAAGYGCVVFMPDHMSSDEGRARYLRALHTSNDNTDYWENNLFYDGKKEAVGEKLDFSTTVEGVTTDPKYYQDLCAWLE